MDYSVYVLPQLVYGQVHADFTGHLSASRQQVSVKIDNHHIGWLQKKLAHSGRGYDEAVRIQANR